MLSLPAAALEKQSLKAGDVLLIEADLRSQTREERTQWKRRLRLAD
jgi:hypothetical protein